MAFRGGRGGRGGGRGGRGAAFDQRRGKAEEFILFPDNPNMPSDPVFPLPSEEQALITSKAKFERFFRESCYYFEEAPKLKKKDKEIEQYSDRFKSKSQAKRESLASYLKLTPSNFPPELIQGSKRVQPDNKKLRWGRDSDTQLLDMFEKLQENNKGDENEGKEKNGGSDDDEPEVAEEESSDDGDYNQNVDFDDDEDDLNMEEEADEDYYE